jgi:hypothetical protein
MFLERKSRKKLPLDSQVARILVFHRHRFYPYRLKFQELINFWNLALTGSISLLYIRWSVVIRGRDGEEGPNCF